VSINLLVGESSVGESSVGESSVGQSSVGQLSFGQSSVGQLSFGQSSVGQLPWSRFYTKCLYNLPTSCIICILIGHTYTNIFHFKALLNVPKLGFFVLSGNPATDLPSNVSSEQGCQMVCFQTKNPNLGKS
jgi:hypothetical protein